MKKLVALHRGRSPEQIIERYADKLRSRAAQDQLPINVDLIASVIGIRKREASYDFAGRIYVEPSGQLVMDINADDYRPRQRFTCAHELIHPAFPGFRHGARYRVDDTTAEHQPNREEEYLCDLGAAALLMPKKLVKDRFEISGGIATVEELAADADVSHEAAGNRLVSLAGESCAFLVFELRHKPADRPALRRGEDVPKRLRLRYARANALDAYLPRFKSAPDDHPIARAWEATGSVDGTDCLPGADDAGVFEISAKAYGGEDRRRVLAVARRRS